jgi:hypothetical protein
VLRKKSPEVIPEKSVTTIDANQSAFTFAQARVYSGASCWQLRSAVWAGKLPAKRLGKSFLILRLDLDAYLKSLPPVEPSKADWLARRHKASAA